MGCNELDSDLLPFPCLITEMCRLTGVDIYGDVLKPPPADLGWTTWYGLLRKLGMPIPGEVDRPPTRKMRRVSRSEAGTSADAEFDRVIPDDDQDDQESDVDEPAVEDDMSQPIGFRILDAVKHTRESCINRYDTLYHEVVKLAEKQGVIETRQDEILIK